MLKLYDLTVEYKSEPLGMDCVQPRFSWKLDSERNDTFQTAYRLTVNGGDLSYDSGRVESEQSVLIEYLGPAFAPRTAYAFEVTVWTNQGESASASSRFETGRLSYKEFEANAKWITHGFEADNTACPVFVKSFEAKEGMKSVRLYATSLGLYEAEVNGEKVDDTFFAPGWTSYHKRLQYQTCAVNNLHAGVNEICFTLGNGWYKGALGFNPLPNHYGDTTALLAMLVITYQDGREEVIGTDESWQVREGEIRFSEIYDGETQDTQRTAEPLRSAVLYEHGYEMITAQENEPVRCLKQLEPVKEFTAPNGDHLFDFGQNLTGWTEVRIQGNAGQTITLRHAESLDENGNFYTENLSFAKATDTYTLNGKEQVLRPHFTFHGFRYVCLVGIEEGQNVCLTACHLSSDLKQTGTFECSDKRVNRLQQNIVWSQRDNYLDIPTDCPQRSERLGWTGDATAFTPTAAFNANVLPFMRKWLRDLAADQDPETGMAQVVPDVLSDGVGGSKQNGSAYWGDAATVVPWTVYEVYGDLRVLKEQYDSMIAWVEYIGRQCGDNGLWQTGFQYGDWLGLDSESNALQDERKGATDDYFAANVCYVWSLDIVAKTSGLLGHTQDEQKYRARYEQVMKAFREEYVTITGRLVSETQTALTLALHFGMVEEKHRAAIAERLAANIAAHKTHLTTGFIGTPYACLALSDHGKHDIAGKLLLQEENPGWLYEVKMGATTIWERWNSILPDRSFNPANMNSLNHYAYGSIGTWLYTRLAGLKLAEAGYKKFIVEPKFIKGITNVNLSFDSVYGQIGIAWRCEKGMITVNVKIPANTTAIVHLPEKDETLELGSGSYTWEYPTETKLELDRYTMEIPLRVMLEHPAAVPLLKQYMPEMTDNPMIQYVMNEPISAMLAYAPQAKPLYEMILQAMNAAEE
ncbi:MAG: family 78 glycoside hydrolase catalytic domain [Oscillospiraceae bacterium]|nr:family 78 glycoside hydrolase catalytic domain [Oscillospiraceae bacterium]